MIRATPRHPVPGSGAPKWKSAADQKRAETIKLALAFAAIYLVWGSTYLAIRYAVETIPPLVTAGIRHSIAGSVLLAWAWRAAFGLHVKTGLLGSCWARSSF